MNKLKIFENPEFGSVRLIEIDGEPWFVGRDVAKALGYGDSGKAATNAVARHVDEDDKGVTEIVTPGGSQKITIINESGLYSLILSSKLPQAKQFKRWVTAEVLPAIHKHGAYMTPEAIEKVLYNPDYLIALANTLKDAQEKNKALTEQVFAQNQQLDAQSQQIAELEPKGAYYDIILQTENTMTTTQIAKDYGFSAQLLTRFFTNSKSSIRKTVRGFCISSMRTADSVRPIHTLIGRVTVKIVLFRLCGHKPVDFSFMKS